MLIEEIFARMQANGFGAIARNQPFFQGAVARIVVPCCRWYLHVVLRAGCDSPPAVIARERLSTERVSRSGGTPGPTVQSGWKRTVRERVSALSGVGIALGPCEVEHGRFRT